MKDGRTAFSVRRYLQIGEAMSECLIITGILTVVSIAFLAFVKCTEESQMIGIAKVMAGVTSKSAIDHTIPQQKESGTRLFCNYKVLSKRYILPY